MAHPIGNTSVCKLGNLYKWKLLKASRGHQMTWPLFVDVKDQKLRTNSHCYSHEHDQCRKNRLYVGHSFIIKLLNKVEQ